MFGKLRKENVETPVDEVTQVRELKTIGIPNPDMTEPKETVNNDTINVDQNESVEEKPIANEEKPIANNNFSDEFLEVQSRINEMYDIKIATLEERVSNLEQALLKLFVKL